MPWLIAKNRHAEARRVLQTAARWNKMTLPEKYRPSDAKDSSSVYTNRDVGKYAMKLNDASTKRTDNAEQETKQYTALDIMASPKLRLYTLVMIYLWYVSHYLTLLPCAVESHPTPGESRGSSSPPRSISGVSCHVADDGPLEYPLSVSSHLCLGLPLLLAPFILPSITSSSIPPALTTCPK